MDLNIKIIKLKNERHFVVRQIQQAEKALEEATGRWEHLIKQQINILNLYLNNINQKIQEACFECEMCQDCTGDADSIF